MTAKWPWNLPERKGSAYMKQLEGIQSTPELHAVLEDIILKHRTTTTTTPTDTTTKIVFDEDDDEEEEETKNGFYSMPHDDAIGLIQDYLKKYKEQKLEHPDTVVSVISLDVLRAAVTLVPDPSVLLTAMTSRSKSTPSKLVYTPPPPPPDTTTREARQFEKRMDRLRLRAEEMRYKQLTNNLDTSIADDVTTKSMTYAASVGLNMIVAPISFGVFMYFFAGQVFAWIAGSNAVPLKAHEVDIKRVIAGVVSGVGMLFIEMILFVIRTHTMDKSMRDKAKRKKMSPFGYIKPNAAPVQGIRGE